MHRGNTEFTLIHQWFADQLTLHAPERGVMLGIGDDAAIVSGETLDPVVSLTWSAPSLSQSTNIDDDPCFDEPSSGERWGSAFIEAAFQRLAPLKCARGTAMVATLSISALESELPHCTAIIAGIQNACTRLGVCIVGGDTTSGPLTVTIFLRRLKLPS